MCNGLPVGCDVHYFIFFICKLTKKKCNGKLFMFSAARQQPNRSSPYFTLTNNTDRLRDIEKKTGYSKVYFALGAVALILTFILSAGGTKLMSDIFGFAYPAYMSFKAIDSSDPIDDTQWLTYWVVFSLFSIGENLFSFLVSWIPFYYIIKLGFFLWLYHPKFMGAGLVYNKVVKWVAIVLGEGNFNWCCLLLFILCLTKFVSHWFFFLGRTPCLTWMPWENNPSHKRRKSKVVWSIEMKIL